MSAADARKGSLHALIRMFVIASPDIGTQQMSACRPTECAILLNTGRAESVQDRAAINEVRFAQYRTFRLAENHENEGPLSAKSGVRQAKRAKDKEVKVLYGERFSQPPRPRVMRRYS